MPTNESPAPARTCSNALTQFYQPTAATRATRSWPLPNLSPGKCRSCENGSAKLSGAIPRNGKVDEMTEREKAQKIYRYYRSEETGKMVLVEPQKRTRKKKPTKHETFEREKRCTSKRRDCVRSVVLAGASERTVLIARLFLRHGISDIIVTDNRPANELRDIADSLKRYKVNFAFCGGPVLGGLGRYDMRIRCVGDVLPGEKPPSVLFDLFPDDKDVKQCIEFL